MNMAGGTWTDQNKVRPGVYIRFSTNRDLGLTVGERGVVTICEALNWGPVGQVMTIANGENMTPYTGYDITNENNRFIREISVERIELALPQHCCCTGLQLPLLRRLQSLPAR